MGTWTAGADHPRRRWILDFWVAGCEGAQGETLLMPTDAGIDTGTLECKYERLRPPPQPPELQTPARLTASGWRQIHAGSWRAAWYQNRLEMVGERVAAARCENRLGEVRVREAPTFAPWA